MPSIVTTYTFLASILILVVICVVFYKSYSDPIASVPGPAISRWTSIVTKIHFLSGSKPNYVQNLHERYGPVVRVGPDEVDISDVDAAKIIHKVGGKFLKSGFYTHIGHRSAKTLFSTTDPKHHAVRRRLLSAPMSETSLKQHEPILQQRVDLCISQMTEELKLRGCIDIFKWWTFLATDVIGELSFGESFKTLEHGEKNQYSMDLEAIAALMALRTSFPFLSRIAQYISIPIFQQAAESGARMAAYAEQSIQRYKRIVTQNVNPRPTLFSNVVNEDGKKLTDAEIRLEAGGYIVAGSDTTAITLTYLVWAVSKDQSIRDRLVAELAALQDGFTDSDLRQLSFLGQVINETLRLYPAAPNGLPRTVPSEGAKLAGYYFPGGLTVSTQAYSLHRDPIVFPDPYSFNPSRWEVPTSDMKAAFMPFGGGSRICIGMHLARMEMRRAVAEFFRAFPRTRVSTKEGMSDGDMEAKMYFLVSPRGHRCLIDTE